MPGHRAVPSAECPRDPAQGVLSAEVHVVEKQRYGKTVKAARLAQDNALLPHEEVFRQQIAVRFGDAQAVV